MTTKIERHSLARTLVSVAALAACFSLGFDARGQDDTERARDEFAAGNRLVKETQWADALAAFERSHKLRPHAVTTFNVGFCQRALGQYARARRTFAQALEANQRTAGELPDSLVEETNGYVEEIDRLLVRAQVKLSPPEATLSVDGRPLLVEPGAVPVLVAGVLPPGQGATPPAATFVLVLDPGPHVLTIRRKGFADAVVNRTFSPGARPTVDLVLDRLPATVEIASNETGASVKVQGTDVGVVPLSLSRPAGSYEIDVQKSGFVPYQSQVVLQPGETTRLRATLEKESPSLLTRWWFWTGAAVVVTGAVIGTYWATRPDPERPAVNGGGLGWVVEMP